jgi:hypothetical protein
VAEMMKGLSKLGPKSMGGGTPKSMGGGTPKAKPAMGAEEHSGGAGMEIHDHGDGSAHSMIDGKREEHPDHMHAVAAVAHHLMPEGHHFHGHSDGFSAKSHGIHESGEHVPTQEHEGTEAMHGAMDQALGGMGEGEGAPQAEASEAAPAMGGFAG